MLQYIHLFCIDNNDNDVALDMIIKIKTAKAVLGLNSTKTKHDPRNISPNIVMRLPVGSGRKESIYNSGNEIIVICNHHHPYPVSGE